jgi:hypothetical protein
MNIRARAIGAVMALILGGAPAFGEEAAAPASVPVPVPSPAHAAVPTPVPSPLRGAQEAIIPASAPAQVQTAPQQQAGVSKPVKVYWYLSGR